MNTITNKTEKRICFVEPQNLNIKKIAVCHGMSMKDLLLSALHEFLEKRGIDADNYQ
ncbi:hypothetical protein DSM106972_056610 [Dulcicalothrix desertica PCC 7102]|uniref:Uncharacterized protein n=1 Tax=Dulcicalothrix desertica PCC 7102 TaxID=232991 RepID=A0A3S1AK35_9CYAN|nr:hypothetical protein [Dulcicalothrix desertica]RUT02741.1 hypothetical protein DSM106972_056610 [Dulcicalothrix desertica PCC 7102]TWH39025.1 hypothetical protein CAL7102_08229 [Dulcicalothrix desertica PCC 7102]